MFFKPFLCFETYFIPVMGVFLSMYGKHKRCT